MSNIQFQMFPITYAFVMAFVSFIELPWHDAEVGATEYSFRSHGYSVSCWVDCGGFYGMRFFNTQTRFDFLRGEFLRSPILAKVGVKLLGLSYPSITEARVVDVSQWRSRSMPIPNGPENSSSSVMLT